MSQKYILGERAQTRKRSVRYVITVALLLLVLAVIQLSFFGRFRVFGAIPDITLAALLCIGYFTGPYTGAVSGIGAGFLIDSLGSTGVTVLPLAYLLAGYFTGHFARRIPTRGFLHYLIFLAVAVLYRALITLIYAWFSYESLPAPFWTGTLLPEMPATALAGLVLYFPMRLLCGWLEKKH